jgi:hypothetical protein
VEAVAAGAGGERKEDFKQFFIAVGRIAIAAENYRCIVSYKLRSTFKNHLLWRQGVHEWMVIKPLLGTDCLHGALIKVCPKTNVSRVNC